MNSDKPEWNRNNAWLDASSATPDDLKVNVWTSPSIESASKDTANTYNANDDKELASNETTSPKKHKYTVTDIIAVPSSSSSILSTAHNTEQPSESPILSSDKSIITPSLAHIATPSKSSGSNDSILLNENNVWADVPTETVRSGSSENEEIKNYVSCDDVSSTIDPNISQVENIDSKKGKVRGAEGLGILSVDSDKKEKNLKDNQQDVEPLQIKSDELDTGEAVILEKVESSKENTPNPREQKRISEATPGNTNNTTKEDNNKDDEKADEKEDNKKDEDDNDDEDDFGDFEEPDEKATPIPINTSSKIQAIIPKDLDTLLDQVYCKAKLTSPPKSESNISTLLDYGTHTRKYYNALSRPSRQFFFPNSSANNNGIRTSSISDDKGIVRWNKSSTEAELLKVLVYWEKLESGEDTSHLQESSSLVSSSIPASTPAPAIAGTALPGAPGSRLSVSSKATYAAMFGWSTDLNDNEALQKKQTQKNVSIKEKLLKRASTVADRLVAERNKQEHIEREKELEHQRQLNIQNAAKREKQRQQAAAAAAVANKEGNRNSGEANNGVGSATSPRTSNIFSPFSNIFAKKHEANKLSSKEAKTIKKSNLSSKDFFKKNPVGDSEDEGNTNKGKVDEDDGFGDFIFETKFADYSEEEEDDNGTGSLDHAKYGTIGEKEEKNNSLSFSEEDESDNEAETQNENYEQKYSTDDDERVHKAADSKQELDRVEEKAVSEKPVSVTKPSPNTGNQKATPSPALSRASSLTSKGKASLTRGSSFKMKSWFGFKSDSKSADKKQDDTTTVATASAVGVPNTKQPQAASALIASGSAALEKKNVPTCPVPKLNQPKLNIDVGKAQTKLVGSTIANTVASTTPNLTGDSVPLTPTSARAKKLDTKSTSGASIMGAPAATAINTANSSTARKGSVGAFSSSSMANMTGGSAPLTPTKTDQSQNEQFKNLPEIANPSVGNIQEKNNLTPVTKKRGDEDEGEEDEDDDFGDFELAAESPVLSTEPRTKIPSKQYHTTPNHVLNNSPLLVSSKLNDISRRSLDNSAARNDVASDGGINGAGYSNGHTTDSQYDIYPQLGISVPKKPQSSDTQNNNRDTPHSQSGLSLSRQPSLSERRRNHNHAPLSRPQRNSMSSSRNSFSNSSKSRSPSLPPSPLVASASVLEKNNTGNGQDVGNGMNATKKNSIGNVSISKPGPFSTIISSNMKPLVPSRSNSLKSKSSSRSSSGSGGAGYHANSGNVNTAGTASSNVASYASPRYAAAGASVGKSSQSSRSSFDAKYASSTTHSPAAMATATAAAAPGAAMSSVFAPLKPKKKAAATSGPTPDNTGANGGQSGSVKVNDDGNDNDNDDDDDDDDFGDFEESSTAAATPALSSGNTATFVSSNSGAKEPLEKQLDDRAVADDSSDNDWGDFEELNWSNDDIRAASSSGATNSGKNSNAQGTSSPGRRQQHAPSTTMSQQKQNNSTTFRKKQGETSEQERIAKLVDLVPGVSFMS